MNVSLAWLNALAPDLGHDVDALVERMAALGFPVEGAEPLGAALGDIVVARVVEAGPHPNADRLSILDQGRLMVEGTPDELKQKVAIEYGLSPTLESVFMTWTGRSLDDDVEDEEND